MLSEVVTQALPINQSSLSLEMWRAPPQLPSPPPPLGNPLHAISGARYRRYILQDFDSVGSSAL